MTSIVQKYFHLIGILFILFGINILKVKASQDCDNFSKVIEYVGDSTFRENYKKELNCCYNKKIINCDENENIVSVQLNNQKVKDIENVISYLGKLEHLVELIINYGDIDYIPSSIENLKNLNVLNLSNNKISSIPENIGNLVKLEHLDLDDNKIKSIPKNFANLKNLFYLNLSRNKFESIPKDLKNLNNLNYLNLAYNEISGYIPLDFLELKKLENLFLNNNKKLDGYVPPFENVKDCDYKDTDLCTLKDEECRASIQCYKEEILDGNKNNGSPDPNAYVDRAITNQEDRNVVSGGQTKNIITGIIIVLAVVLMCVFCHYCAPEDEYYVVKKKDTCIIS